LLNDITDLLKTSEGCINMDDIYDLDVFEFLFYQYKFNEIYKDKLLKTEENREEMASIVIEGIKSLHRTLGG
jgi:hypothetical protein